MGCSGGDYGEAFEEFMARIPRLGALRLRSGAITSVDLLVLQGPSPDPVLQG